MNRVAGGGVAGTVGDGPAWAPDIDQDDVLIDIWVCLTLIHTLRKNSLELNEQ